MRIDKYLWCLRYYKTRHLAAQACRKQNVKCNGVVAKPGRNVYPTDMIELKKNKATYQITVNNIPFNRVSAKDVDYYCKDNTPKNDNVTKTILNTHKNCDREKGTGRPTKKERRAIDDFHKTT